MAVVTLTTAGGLATLSGQPAVAGPASLAPVARTEVSLSGPGQPADGITATSVTLYSPLPASAPAHPAACDYVTYVKYRLTSASAAPLQADAVYVAQPGATAASNSLDRVARNTVTTASQAGKKVQFWALNRRGTCLQDNRGITAAAQAGDPTIAYDYYFRRAAINGQRFGGFLTNSQLAVASDFGLARVVEDQNFVMRHEMPDPAFRKTRTLCGGHSMGAFVAAALVSWDFDGTATNAGYNQCAGVFALDSLADIDPLAVGGFQKAVANLTGLRTSNDAALAKVLKSGALPRALQLGPISLAKLNIIAGIAAVAANADPDGASTMSAQLPREGSTDLLLNTLMSPNLASLVSGVPGWRAYRLTNDAMLATLFDDNSEAISGFQVSLGTYAGRVVEKTTPVPASVAQVPFIGTFLAPAVGSQARTAPLNPYALTGWRDYRASNGTAPQRTASGKQVNTTPEVVDIADFARTVASGPNSYIESYFPTRVLGDVLFSLSGDRSGDLAHVKYEDQLAAKANLAVLGQQGLVQFGGAQLLWPKDTVVLKGYNHLDVLAASPDQTDGRPEQVSANLVSWGLRAIR